jgi:Concanavalin A-like lectin/glucanases superfamily
MDQRFTVTFPPGVVRNDSAYAVKGRYINSSLVHFWEGKPQKWGGWGNYFNIGYTEPVRGAVVWNGDDGRTLSAYGTANKLWIIRQGVQYDITPAGLTAGLVDTATTDSGWGALGWGAGPWGGGFSAFAGQGSFPRVWTVAKWGQDLVACPRGGPIYFWSYANAPNLALGMTGTVAAASTTVSALSAPGSIKVGDRVTGNFILPNTFVVSVNVGASTMVITQAALGAGAAEALSFTTPAVAMSTLTADAKLPTSALGIFVTDSRELVAFGAAVSPKVYDALNVAWCTREDFTVWTPSATNTAGAIRCETGNQIMGVSRVFGGFLIITDLSAHPFTFVGGDDVWGLDRVGSTGGAISPLAIVEVDGVAYWMGYQAFYSYNGRVNTMPSDVHEAVFNNINRVQGYKICAGTNRKYGEILFFFPGALTSLENDSFAAVNTFDGSWSIGGVLAGSTSFSRTTWLDANALFKTPLGLEGINRSTGAGGNDTATKILLHMNSTEVLWTDSNAGGGSHTWTPNGSASIDVTNVKLGTGCGLFNGTTDYITTPDSADYTLGTGDWTLDCWFNIAAGDGAGGVLRYMAGQADAAAANFSLTLDRAASNKINVLVGLQAGGSVSLSSANNYTGATNGGWHHLAIVRSGGTLSMYIDGILENSTAISGAVFDSAANWSVGRLGQFASSFWSGRIDEFRLSVGIARWTANFTPPVDEYGTGYYKIYQQESGTTADGFPIPYILETGEVELKDQNGSVQASDTFLRLKKIVPDFAYLSGQHALTVEARGYPNDTAVNKGPYDMSGNAMFNPKARGRHFRFLMTGTGDFRIGDFEAYAAPDGGRR